jgi:DNA-binding transcriptional LysR family regulator
MLHSRLLRYLDEVARSGSIRKAAERLNVASSAVNRQILALEEELGTTIFQRLPRRLRLTAAGEILIEHVRQTLKEHERVQARIHDLKGLSAGQVTVATMNGPASGILPQVAADFRQRYPRIKVTIRSLFIDDIVNAVISGEADLGFAYNMPTDPHLHTIEAFETPLGAVVASNHPLAARSPVRLSECADFPVILADPSMTIHRIMTAAFERANLVVEPRFCSNSLEFLKALVRSEGGVTFLSAVDVAQEQRAGTLVYLPIQDRSFPRQTLSLVHRARRAIDAGASMFAEVLRRTVRDLLHTD